mgnify:CR=1 FL=1
MLEVCVRHAFACLQLPAIILPQVLAPDKENWRGKAHSGCQHWRGKYLLLIYFGYLCAS